MLARVLPVILNLFILVQYLKNAQWQTTAVSNSAYFCLETETDSIFEKLWLKKIQVYGQYQEQWLGMSRPMEDTATK
jgi:hypothetical protein